MYMYYLLFTLINNRFKVLKLQSWILDFVANVHLFHV